MGRGGAFVFPLPQQGQESIRAGTKQDMGFAAGDIQHRCRALGGAEEKARGATCDNDGQRVRQ